jgi:hypothetical protein
MGQARQEQPILPGIQNAGNFIQKQILQLSAELLMVHTDCLVQPLSPGFLFGPCSYYLHQLVEIPPTLDGNASYLLYLNHWL